MADNRPDVYEEGGQVVYRASSVGQCVRALVASGLGEQEVFGADRRALLDRSAAEGNLHEQAVIDKLVGEGWKVIHAQETVEIPVIPGVIVRGHTDGVLQSPHHPNPQVLLEVKSMSTKQFDKWMKRRFDAFPKYAFQISAYMRAHPDLDALYVVKRREDGLLDRSALSHSLPPVQWSVIRKKITTAERWRRKGELPPCDVKDQWGCPFFYLHEEADLEEVVIPDDEIRMALEGLIADFVALKEKERLGEEAGELRKKEVSPEILRLLSGDYLHVEVGGTIYKVTKSGTTRSWVDMAAMREDGHGDLLDAYTKTRRVEYPLVREVKEK